MDNSAYDISQLLALEADLLGTGTSAKCNAQRVQSEEKRPRRVTVAEAQDALSRELMRTAEIHDALVQQYLHTTANQIQGNHDVDDA